VFKIPSYYLKDGLDQPDDLPNEEVWSYCEHLLRKFKSFSYEAEGNIKLFPDGSSSLDYRPKKN